MNLNLKEGEYLVRVARKAIKTYFESKRVMDRPEDFPDVLEEKRGVFVTLNTFPDRRLRGCIGYPVAHEPLIDGTIASAISAAFSDPRFMPLTEDELDNIIVEVTVLTPMLLLDKAVDYAKQIKIGQDGLMIVCGANSGLLLPQVPVEWNWDVNEFLKQICVKAGLYTDCYENKNCNLYRFGGQIFEEKTPNGVVTEKEI